jgi:hypothetical protein
MKDCTIILFIMFVLAEMGNGTMFMMHAKDDGNKTNDTCYRTRLKKT